MYISKLENQREPSRVSTLWWPAVLVFLLCSPIYLNYWAYSIREKQYPDAMSAFFNGRFKAPEQYRIAIPWLARFVSEHLQIGMRHAFGAIDLLASWIAVLLLYHLLQRLLLRTSAIGQVRLLSNALFAGLVLYYFIWIDWYQRAETLPSAAFVAVTLFLAARRLPFRGGKVVAGLTMIGLAILQGLIRADVAAAIHLAILCVCVVSHPKREDDTLAVGRGMQAFVSAMALVCACGVQLYVMRVLYPHATYGDTALIQFLLNLTVSRMIPFVLFVLPAVITWIFLSRRYAELDAGGRIMLTASMIYLVLWFVVGSIAEVRIFLPFALALSPWTATAIGEMLIRREQSMEQPALTFQGVRR
jgi:hypothetical protein